MMAGQTIYISATLSGTESGTFSRRIDLPFYPSSVTVSNVYYEHDGTEALGFSVKTGIVDSLDSVLFLARDTTGFPLTPIVFPCKSGIKSGMVDFEWEGATPRNGLLTFALTFK